MCIFLPRDLLENVISLKDILIERLQCKIKGKINLSSTNKNSENSYGG
jgi:hypothetical protein